MRIPAKPEDIAEVYADESSQNKHKFLVLGAIVVPFLERAAIEQKIIKARLPELPNGEVKWTKVSRSKLPAYKRIVDVLFDHPDNLQFHSLHVDTTQQDHKKYNRGDSEIGFNKELYQLANKIGQLYPKHYFHLYPDYRDTKNSPEELRLILNRGAAKRGDERDWPIRRTQFRDSKQTHILQMADIIIGSIAFQLNGHGRVQGANPAKIELAKYITDRAGIRDIEKGTARTGKFTVWPRRLKRDGP